MTYERELERSRSRSPVDELLLTARDEKGRRNLDSPGATYENSLYFTLSLLTATGMLVLCSIGCYSCWHRILNTVPASASRMWWVNNVNIRWVNICLLFKTVCYKTCLLKEATNKLVTRARSLTKHLRAPNTRAITVRVAIIVSYENNFSTIFYENTISVTIDLPFRFVWLASGNLLRLPDEVQVLVVIYTLLGGPLAICWLILMGRSMAQLWLLVCIHSCCCGMSPLRKIDSSLPRRLLSGLRRRNCSITPGLLPSQIVSRGLRQANSATSFTGYRFPIAWYLVSSIYLSIVDCVLCIPEEISSMLPVEYL